jgi:hypothetical protein
MIHSAFGLIKKLTISLLSLYIIYGVGDVNEKGDVRA